MSVDIEQSSKMKLLNEETKLTKLNLVKDEIKPSPHLGMDGMKEEEINGGTGEKPTTMASTKPKKEIADVKPMQDKAIQTEEYTWLQELVESIVVARIKAYQRAAENSEHIDQKLSPILKSIKKENTELRENASIFKSRLERIDRIQSNQRKRSAMTEAEITPNKRSISVTNSITPPTDVGGGKVNIVIEKPVHSSPLAPAQPTPFLSPVRSVYLQSAIQQPQQFYQILPTSMAGAQQRVLIQPSYPTPKVPREGGFMVLDNAAAPSYNISTQVVVANQGLRMASLPNVVKDNRTQQQRPIGYSTSGKPYTLQPPPGPNSVTRFPCNQPVNNNNTNRNVWSNNQRQIAIAPRKQQMVGFQNNQQLATTTVSMTTNTSANKHENSSISSGNQPPLSNEARIALPFNPLPKLKASISASGNGIILTWDYETPGEDSDKYQVECYQLFAHQAKCNLRPRGPNDIRPWKKIGVVNALPLPMACTLTQFATGNVYYFAVVAVDIHGREGEMSNPCIIRLNLNP